MKIKGQTALITGASRGIGQAIAVALGQAGAYVIGTATSEKGIASIKDTILTHRIEGEARILNVATKTSVKQLKEILEKNDCKPSILVNNAGITSDNLLIRMADNEWEQVINTNLNSVYRLSKLCLRSMIRARHGRIINITSVIALSGNSGQANYAASKAGIIGFTRSLAREVGSRGVTVNAVAPGFIETDMTKTLPVEKRAALLEQIALNRLGQAEDVAKVVAFLASEDAAYITGETINVSGGMFAG